MPFFRAHAHIDTKRREPYLYGDPYKSMMRDIIRLRYQMLPVWYTAFHEASLTNAPTMRWVMRRTLVCQSHKLNS
jgi:alpha 1,3-glucosidase